MKAIATGSRVILRNRIPSDLDCHLRWRSAGEWRAYDAPWAAVRSPMTDEEEESFRKRFLDSCRDTADTPRRRATTVTVDGEALGWVNRHANDRSADRRSGQLTPLEIPALCRRSQKLGAVS